MTQPNIISTPVKAHIALKLFFGFVTCAVSLPTLAYGEGLPVTGIAPLAPLLEPDVLANNAPADTPAKTSDSLLSLELDARHEACIEKIALDPDAAYEDALIWKGDGGARRARHCTAVALFALGHKDEAAHRLEELAAETFSGTPAMRADYYAEAADFWIAAGEYENAYTASSAGLEVSNEHLDLRLARARAYAKLERWEFAEIDLTSALAFHPGNEKALRYRADARRRLGKYAMALADIEAAMAANPMSVESALVRGEIREEIRLMQSKN